MLFSRISPQSPMKPGEPCGPLPIATSAAMPGTFLGAPGLLIATRRVATRTAGAPGPLNLLVQNTCKRA